MPQSHTQVLVMLLLDMAFKDVEGTFLLEPMPPYTKTRQLYQLTIYGLKFQAIQTKKPFQDWSWKSIEG